jgi:hypothetical protein
MLIYKKKIPNLQKHGMTTDKPTGITKDIQKISAKRAVQKSCLNEKMNILRN